MAQDTLLIRNADVVATMDQQQRELRGASILIRGNEIIAVGEEGSLDPELTASADRVLDARGHVVIPGMVNTHHHMYQSLTRALPAAQNTGLFGWLRAYYPIWAGLTPDMIRASTKLAVAELLLCGCTTTSDHLYVFPDGVTLENSIEAATEMGIRFCATRGSMSIGESGGGLPPDSVVEDEDYILRDSQDLVTRYHDPAKFSMLQVALAPCSQFSVSQDLMRETANLARSLGVRLHTHLAESMHDVEFSLERFGQTPAEYAESVGWLGDDVWHAHCVQIDDAGISAFARSQTGVCHCPGSLMRIGAGVAPVRKMLDAGIPVGMGVDGSSSNEVSSLPHEMRLAMLAARTRPALTGDVVDNNAAELGPRDVLQLVTTGGARLLGRNDIGRIAPGMAADLALFDLGDLEFAGAAVHDPVAAIALSVPRRAAYTIVNGRMRVENGQLVDSDLREIVTANNKLARELVA